MRELTRDMQTKCDYSDRKDPKHKVMAPLEFLNNYID